MTFAELSEQHLGLAVRKQLALADLLGKHSWQLDINRGTVDFGKSGLFSKPRVYPVQIIGTQAELSSTWLWAWANTGSEIPDAVLRDANRLRDFGASTGISELVTPQLSSDDYPGHLLASIASGICAADCYYRGPYPGGAVFFLLYDTPLKSASPSAVLRISTVLTDVIRQYEVQNHRNMAASYLLAEGFQLTDTTSGFAASAKDGRALTIAFDSHGRLSNIESTVGSRTGGSRP